MGSHGSEIDKLDVKQNKSVVTLIDNVSIATGASNTSGGVSLADVIRLALSVIYTAPLGSTAGITVYLYTSHDNSHWDTDELTSFEPSHTANTTIQKTVFLDPDAYYMKAKVTAKSGSGTVTAVMVTLTETKETIENA